MTTLNCRSMYVYQLAKVIQSEGSISAMVDRARKAGIKSVWLKVANGKLRHQNITGNNKAVFVALRSALHCMQPVSVAGVGRYPGVCRKVMRKSRQNSQLLSPLSYNWTAYSWTRKAV